MPFEVKLKGWLQVSNCLLCPETILVPPGTLIRFGYGNPDIQHYYRVTTIIDGVHTDFVLSRDFHSRANPIDGGGR